MANATNKTYLVTDEFGTELKTLKTLAAAKKLADSEGGKVVCDGEVVYQAPASTPDTPAEQESIPAAEQEETAPEAVTEAAPEAPVTDDDHTDAPAVEETQPAEEPEKPDEKPAVTEKKPMDGELYRLTALMNIRLKPSLTADIVGQGKPGTKVRVLSIENDWMKVANGASFVYILYGAGKFAQRA